MAPERLLRLCPYGQNLCVVLADVEDLLYLLPCVVYGQYVLPLYGLEEYRTNNPLRFLISWSSEGGIPFWPAVWNAFELSRCCMFMSLPRYAYATFPSSIRVYCLNIIKDTVLLLTLGEKNPLPYDVYIPFVVAEEVAVAFEFRQACIYDRRIK